MLAALGGWPSGVHKLLFFLAKVEGIPFALIVTLGLEEEPEKEEAAWAAVNKCTRHLRDSHPQRPRKKPGLAV